VISCSAYPKAPNRLERPSGNSGDGNHRVYAADIGNDSKGPKFAESSLILGPEWSRLQFPQPLRAQQRMNMPDRFSCLGWLR